MTDRPEGIFPLGEENVAYAKYFTGTSYLCPLSKEQVFIANVTFEPGCRNFWHIHHAQEGGGQTLARRRKRLVVCAPCRGGPCRGRTHGVVRARHSGTVCGGGT